MRTLDLFSGLGGWSAAFKDRGHDVVTVDNVDRFNPTLVADVLELPLDYAKNFDVILASPPCEGFSVSSIGKMWNKDYTPKHPKARLGLTLLRKTIELVSANDDNLFFIENPRGMMRKRPILHKFKRYTVTYCQYGENRMKPTDIWTNSKLWNPRPPCKNGDTCRVRAPRGSRTGTQGIPGSAKRAKIPYDLSLEVCIVCEEELG